MLNKTLKRLSFNITKDYFNHSLVLPNKSILRSSSYLNIHFFLFSAFNSKDQTIDVVYC